MDYKEGDKVKYKSLNKWVYGTIDSVNDFVPDVNEFNYIVKREDGNLEELEYEDLVPVFNKSGDYSDEIDIIIDSLKSVYSNELNNNEVIRKNLREALNRIDDYRKEKPVQINPLGTDNILKVNSIEISGDSTGSDVWYKCEDGELYQDLCVNEVYVPDNIKNFIKQVWKVEDLDLNYTFSYKIKV